MALTRGLYFCRGVYRAHSANASQRSSGRCRNLIPAAGTNFKAIMRSL
jgi:hypothetical protein